jgi:hypothetical protein
MGPHAAAANARVPARVEGFDDVTRFALGVDTCALTASRALHCWGNARMYTYQRADLLEGRDRHYTLRALRDKDAPMEIDRARVISQVAATVIDSARAEIEHLHAGLGADERQEGCGLSFAVILLVSLRAVGGGENGGVVLRMGGGETGEGEGAGQDGGEDGDGSHGDLPFVIESA